VVPSRELFVDAKRLPADAQILRNKHEKAFTELRIKADAIDHELALGPNPLEITEPNCNELVQESPNIFALRRGLERLRMELFTSDLYLPRDVCVIISPFRLIALRRPTTFTKPSMCGFEFAITV